MAAVLGNDEALAGAVVAAAERAGELAWRLPIPDDAPVSLRSTVADLRNTGPVHGGMLYAAGFLREFVGSGPSGAPIPWAHVDILGPALNRDEAYGYTPKGGTGYGVQTLVALAEDLAAR
jgi:leucyl aminopeptidase